MVRTTPRERSVVRRPGGFCLHLSGSAAPFTARDRCLLLPFLAHASLSWPRCPGARDGAAAGAAAALDHSRHGAGRR